MELISTAFSGMTSDDIPAACVRAWRDTTGMLYEGAHRLGFVLALAKSFRCLQLQIGCSAAAAGLHWSDSSIAESELRLFSTVLIGSGIKSLALDPTCRLMNPVDQFPGSYWVARPCFSSHYLSRQLLRLNSKFCVGTGCFLSRLRIHPLQLAPSSSGL